MSDPYELRELDPYVLLYDERTRLDNFFGSRQDHDWDAPTRCEGWALRDLLAHLAASEEYNQACLEDSVPSFLEQQGARGATDLDSINGLGVSDRAGRSPAEVLEEWRTATTRTHRGLRHRDGQLLNTAAGPYPARLQAFHLAAELATHADDAGVAETDDERPGRVDWRAKFSRFVLAEEKHGLRVSSDSGRTHVIGADFTVTLDDAVLVEAVAARLPAGNELSDEVRSALSMNS
ncbi:MAG: hypothetical protein JWL70_1074 [Acidimicrobiia bacterium]|nr:hypothetical protein [Acidimicrobiia bacterium]